MGLGGCGNGFVRAEKRGAGGGGPGFELGAGDGVEWLRLRGKNLAEVEEGAIALSGLAVDPALIAAEGAEEGAVVALAGEGVRGGHEFVVEAIDEGSVVHVVGAEEGAAGGEGLEFGVVEFLGDEAGEANGFVCEGKRELEGFGVEAVLVGVLRGALFAGGGAGAGGFEGVGAVGGELFFGNGHRGGLRKGL